MNNKLILAAVSTTFFAYSRTENEVSTRRSSVEGSFLLRVKPGYFHDLYFLVGSLLGFFHKNQNIKINGDSKIDAVQKTKNNSPNILNMISPQK